MYGLTSKRNFQHDFARMTDEGVRSVGLTYEAVCCLFRERNNQRLSPRGKPVSYSPDRVTICMYTRLFWLTVYNQSAAGAGGLGIIRGKKGRKP